MLAAILARQGVGVLLVEAESHPRFHHWRIQVATGPKVAIAEPSSLL